jgi:hypothetical protein
MEVIKENTYKDIKQPHLIISIGNKEEKPSLWACFVDQDPILLKNLQYPITHMKLSPSKKHIAFFNLNGELKVTS